MGDEPKKPKPKRKPAKTPVNKAIETAPENKAIESAGACYCADCGLPAIECHCE